jgi:imidazolonepropionase-like amidohydrolase
VRRARRGGALALLLAAAAAGAGEDPGAADVAAARAVFDANLDAIRARDRDAYLATYLRSPALARSGPAGPALGYEGHAATAGEGWPDVFEAQDLRLVPVRPGVVYGTYRYRVRYGEDEQSGLSERVFVATPEGWRIAVTSAFPAPPGTPPPPRALVGATLVDGSGGAPVADAVVVVRDGTIACAGPRAACPLPEEAGVVDLAGRWLTPGLVDAHVHFSQTGWADGRPDALDVRDLFPYETAMAELRQHPERRLRALLCAGVTAAFDVGGYPWTLDLPARAATDTRAPRLAAAGPLLSTLDHWVNLAGERQFRPILEPAAARDGVRYVASRGADAVKVWFIVRRPEDFAGLAAAVQAAGEEAARAELPLVVHATELESAKAALRAGARVLVHSVWDAPVDDELLDLLRGADAVYTPTLTVPDGYVRLFDAVAAEAAPRSDDPHGCVDATTRERLAATARLGAGRVDPSSLATRREHTAELARLAAANLRRVHAAGLPIAMGTDAGNPLTLHGPSVYAELEAMQAAGMPAAAVVVAATRGGARAMGRDAELGTIAAGKAADLLVLGEDPTRDVRAFRSLQQVMRGGVLRPVTELAAGPPP